ncbi:AAA family ATPase [Actinoplanes sp. NPDC024001]|uniref:AAA family ATPase n=1 Tax=Actinoplanes sp. NPDC024001 TaxID=3154598 RepID=UPI0033F8F832
MRVTEISIRTFLGIDRVTVSTDRPLTVITGANGSGKSRLIHALRMARAAVAGADRISDSTLDTEWAGAGHHGSGSFQVKVRIDFGEPDERSLLEAFHWAAAYALLHPEGEHADQLEDAIDAHLPADAVVPLLSGWLIVDFDQWRRHHWQVAWEFARNDGVAHVQLIGPEAGNLVDGSVEEPDSRKQRLVDLVPSTNNVIERIRDGIAIDPLARLDNAVIEFVAAATHFRTSTPQKIALLWRRIGFTPGPRERGDPGDLPDADRQQAGLHAARLDGG